MACASSAVRSGFDRRGGIGHWLSLTIALAFTAAFPLPAEPTSPVETLPILWQAGGQSAGNDSAGQAARLAVDTEGNVAVVSGPSEAKDLAVTSYTSTGAFRWKSVVTPTSGTFEGDWVAAAPNGDFVAVGRNSTSSGQPIAITMVRFGSDGALQWRVDLAATLPSVGRLLVDSGGYVYLAYNAVGDGQDIVVRKYSPSGTPLWSQVINTDFFSNNISTSLVLSADETEVAAVGDTAGGAQWITALFDTSTGTRKWLVVAPEGTAALDVVMDTNRVYVTGQGVTNPGTPSMKHHLTVIAYDRATGTRLWRTNKIPVGGLQAAGLRMAMAPDGSVVATGQASLGFLDWYTVAFETNGHVRWEAVRDGGLNTDEIPAGLLVTPDGTTVVTGKGGPNLPGGYIPGVTAGYSSAGTLLWEAFSPLATRWVAALPNGDVCATGGYDAYVACFRPPSVGRVGTVPDGGTEGGPPLLMGKNLDGSLSLNWSGTCILTETDYEVYEGALGMFSTHVPVVCSTGSLTATTFTPSVGSAYYLVVACDDAFEGSYGNDSAGNARPPGPVQCLPTAGALGCQ